MSQSSAELIGRLHGHARFLADAAGEWKHDRPVACEILTRRAVELHDLADEFERLLLSREAREQVDG
jgi:hypothetical protein